MTMQDGVYRMRAPCPACGSEDGRIETRSGQDCVRCLNCNRHCYNAPKTETGREQRSHRTRPNIKPSQRSRILDRDQGLCVVCHRADVDLDLGHLISVEDGKRLGMTNDEIYSDANLAAMCAPCNSGYGALSVSPRLFLNIIRARNAS